MTLRCVPLALVLTAMLAGCSMLRTATGTPQVSAGYQPVAKGTVWPVVGGDPTSCATSGPGPDTPTPQTPAADSLKVRNKTVRRVVATLCSFTIPAPKTNNGALQDPLH